MDRVIDLRETQLRFAEYVRQVRQGTGVVVTEDGQPLARLAPFDSAPRHRAREARYGVTLTPEFEPGDARLARLTRESQVPWRLRALPR